MYTLISLLGRVISGVIGELKNFLYINVSKNKKQEEDAGESSFSC